MKKVLGTLFVLSAASIAVAKEVNIKFLGTGCSRSYRTLELRCGY
ncbi:2',3'-cyclic-nucleotide 2'-phosphodiesterase [Actinobacillus pleuropneumoniae]|nr:2',3'-cyclic-nucleotide 2'-phosphodiesterase [Actinobacillus pleuropneumoniae]